MYGLTATTNVLDEPVVHDRAASQITMSCIGNPLPPLSKVSAAALFVEAAKVVEYSTMKEDMPLEVLIVVLIPSIVAEPQREIDSPWSLVAETEQPEQDWPSLSFQVILGEI